MEQIGFTGNWRVKGRVSDFNGESEDGDCDEVIRVRLGIEENGVNGRRKSIHW